MPKETVSPIARQELRVHFFYCWEKIPKRSNLDKGLLLAHSPMMV